MQKMSMLRNRWILLIIVVVLQLQCVLSSSRSPPRQRPATSFRKKRKRKRRITQQKRGDDPHDTSSSSPSFLPLVFSDDNDREEGILSALARLELEEDDDEEEDTEGKIKEKQSLKKMKGEMKKALASVNIERTATKKQESRSNNEADDQKTVANHDEKVNASKDASITSTGIPLVTEQDETQRSSPRQKFEELSSELPPRPTWRRPEQQEPLQNRPPMTSSTRSIAGVGVRSQLSLYPFVPPTTMTSSQTKQQQQQRAPVDAHSSTTRWVRKFLAARPKDTLLPIPREYMSDGFNLVQLAPIVERIVANESGYVPPASTSKSTESFPLFKAALRLILSNEDEPASPTIQRAAEVLYTLVHARYVISPRGLDTVRRVLRRSDGTIDPVFGRCPRVHCRGMPLLPYGDSDDFDPRKSVKTRAKRYCSCCGETFYLWESKTDESAWGPSFCHLFLMIYGPAVFPDLDISRTATSSTTGRNATTETDPTIFGFKVHPASQFRYSVGDS